MSSEIEIYKKLCNGTTDVRLLLELINSQKEKLFVLVDAGYAEVHAKIINNELLSNQNKTMQELYLAEIRKMGVYIERLAELGVKVEPE